MGSKIKKEENLSVIEFITIILHISCTYKVTHHHTKVWINVDVSNSYGFLAHNCLACFSM